MNAHRSRIAGLLVTATAALLLAGGTVTVHAITAPPPKDCDTPNASNGVGVLETPQSINAQTQQPYLTKTLTSTFAQPGSTTYTFTLTTTRSTANDTGSGATVTYGASTLTDTSMAWTTNQWTNATVSVNAGAEVATVASNTANTLTLTAPWTTQPAAGSPYAVSFFSELLDCAWDVTEGGNASNADYATQQNAATFTANGTLTISLDVNNSDAICDRVQLKGNDPTTGAPFTDYSNLVGSPSGTVCSPGTGTPEVPATVLIAVIGGGAVAGYFYLRRRRSRSIPVS